MAHLVRHEPSQWRFVRAESEEHRTRRVARQKLLERVDRARSLGTGLWWYEQRYVDQVVPSSLVNPDYFDTFNYRYQVFAHPSHARPLPSSLAEATDKNLPLRYNVRRMAADKVWTPGCVPCAHHWEAAPWQLECCPPIRPQSTHSSTGHHHEVQPPCPVRDALISPCRGDEGDQGSPRTSNSGEYSQQQCRELSARKPMRNEECMKLVDNRQTPKVAQLFAHPLEPEHNRCRDRLIAHRNKCRGTLDTVSALLVDDFNNSCAGFDERVNDLNNNSCAGNGGRIDDDRFSVDEMLSWDTDAPRECADDVPGWGLPPLLPPVGWLQNKVTTGCAQNYPDQRPQCVPARHSQNVSQPRAHTTDEASRTHCKELLGHLESHVRPRCAVERKNLDDYRGERYPDPPVYEDAPHVGYMTSRIVGGKQYRLPPPKNYLAKVKLPPHLAEYREFCRRCPNPSVGRYDRSDPANEMLLVGHASALTMPSSRSPFMFTRNPKCYSYSPLFYCPASSQLCWTLPGEVTRSH